MKKITVCGGDERFYYLCRFLISEGYSVKWIFAERYASDEPFIEKENHSLDNAYALIFPLPLSRDGENLNTPFSDRKIKLSALDTSEKYSVIFTGDKRIQGINYFESEAVLTDNARLTAAGFLKELLIYEKRDILGRRALVTGFGRVSQAVCDILYRNGLSVTVAARNENQRHTAKSRGYSALEINEAAKKLCAYDYVINTVPEKLFSREEIEKAGRNTAFFELASSLCDKTVFTPETYIECKGMPGKHTPESAGRVIADFVCEKLRE